MNREQRNRIVIGVAIVAALITGVMIGTAREDDAQGGGAQSALASGDLNESAGGALTSGLFRDIAKAQSPMVVNIRTESRRQTRDLSEFFRGNELLERFFSFPQLPAVLATRLLRVR